MSATTAHDVEADNATAYDVEADNATAHHISAHSAADIAVDIAADNNNNNNDDHPFAANNSCAMNDPRHCILVGNGTTVLDHRHGPLIDAFENVVRFNRFVTKGFEAHVGTKTDYWFNVDLPQYLGARLAGVYKRIYLHSWEPNQEKDGFYQSFKQALPEGGYEKVDHAVIEEMVRYAQTPDYRCWSTGALAIWMMLKSFPQVCLTGFDWWARQEHHYGDAGTRGALHQPNIEKQYIDRLCAEHKVTFL